MRTGLRDRYILALAVLLVAGAVLLLAPSIRGNDGVLNFVYLRSLIFDGNLDFTNEYAHFDSVKNYQFKFADVPLSPVTGHPVNRYGIGSAVLWMPFFLLAHGATVLLNAAGVAVAADGYSFPYVLAISIGSALYASLGLVLTYLFCSRHFSHADSVTALILCWLATPLVFYMYFHPSMSHANSFFLSAAFIYVYFSRPAMPQIAQWALLGFLGGLLVATRFQDATFLMIPIAGEICTACYPEQSASGTNTKERWFAYLTAGIAFIIAFSPQLLTWKYLYGSYFSGPTPYLQYEGFDVLSPRYFVKVLFSSRHGLYFWHPILLVGTIGLLLRPRLHTREKILLTAGFMATLYLVSCWVIWHAGASFGHRMFVSAVPIFAFGLANVVALVRRAMPKALLVAIVCIFVLWNFGLIVQYATGMIPRQAEVSAFVLVRNQFTRVPENVAGSFTNFSVKRAEAERDLTE